MYTAVVLDEKSRKNLLNVFADEIRALQGFQIKTAQGDSLVHHVTVNMGDFDESLNDKSLLGQEVVMNVVSFAKDERVAAFGVEFLRRNNKSVFGTPSINTINNIPHITAAIKEGGKPFYSNKLTNWKPTYKVVEVCGILQVCN